MSFNAAVSNQCLHGAYNTRMQYDISLLMQLPSRNLELELTMSSSNYHVEMNPSDVGNNDRYVVQEIIKVSWLRQLKIQTPLIHTIHWSRPLCTVYQEMAKSRPLDVRGQKGFKMLVLNEVDQLSKDAQASLRRTMEKYSSACRLVLACNNVSKVPPKLQASATLMSLHSTAKLFCSLLC